MHIICKRGSLVVGFDNDRRIKVITVEVVFGHSMADRTSTNIDFVFFIDIVRRIIKRLRVVIGLRIGKGIVRCRKALLACCWILHCVSVVCCVFR